LSSEGQPQRAQNASDLLGLLRNWGNQSQEHNTLLLISIGMLATDDAGEAFWEDFSEMVSAFRRRHHAAEYTLSPTDRACLVKLTEFNQVTLFTDAKVELLRLIQQYFPDQFGMIDQSRLLRPIDLRFKLPNAIRFLERYEEKEHGSAKPAAVRRKLRRLGEQDIDRVVEVNQQIGTESFAKVFIRHQRMVEILPGGPPQDVMREYFVGMDALKSHVFLDVELRGSGNIFNQLTITLDRLLLDAFGDANPGRVACSINLNVESVFTRAFQNFLDEAEAKSFDNLVFEFRQANVLQQFDEYEVAASLISSRKGRIAIDAVFPETVGIVNMQRLSADYAKIFWRQGAETVLQRFNKEIEELQSQGTKVILARVDDDLGIQVGHDLGITLFQGFHVDDMVKGGG
jgi:hypothetical protein